jgi:chromosome segregation ATPase
MSDLDPTDRPVDAAVEAAADETGVGREELLKRAIVALAEEEGIDVPDAEEVSAIESRMEALDAELDEKVEDLRERFVELYRDVEAKAPADHAHAETVERVDALAADLDRIADRLDGLEADAGTGPAVDEAVDERVGGIDRRLADVESRVADLAALEARVDDLDVDDLDDKLSRVASAVVRVRRRLEAAERDRADRERLDALAATANRNGVRKAACTDCGETVDVGLLTEPECPHCGRAFAELEPNPGFLGTSRLLVEEQPVLDGDVDDESGAVSTRDAGGNR